MRRVIEQFFGFVQLQLEDGVADGFRCHQVHAPLKQLLQTIPQIEDALAAVERVEAGREAHQRIHVAVGGGRAGRLRPSRTGAVAARRSVGTGCARPVARGGGQDEASP